MNYYPINIAGVDRKLPICPVNENLYIGAFVIFGDVELTTAAAKALLEKAPEYDYMITAEAKGIPLIHEMARLAGDKKYMLARKAPKLYMTGVFEVEVNSITTAKKQTLYLETADAELMRGKKILIIDDVISTGESLRALEVLVEKAIELIPKNAVFADICTGSGCLGISVLKERPDLKAILLDISPIAKRVCEKNISSLGVADRCSFIQFDLFNDTLPQCSAILMNPPYITKEEMKKLPRNVMREPALALDGGEDGLDFYRYAASSKDFKNKLLIFEIGYMQGIALRELFGGGDIVPDLSGNDRVFILQ